MEVDSNTFLIRGSFTTVCKHSSAKNVRLTVVHLNLHFYISRRLCPVNSLSSVVDENRATLEKLKLNPELSQIFVWKISARIRIIRNSLNNQHGFDLPSAHTKGEKHLSFLKQTNYACERNPIGNTKPGEGRLAGAKGLVNNEVV